MTTTVVLQLKYGVDSALARLEEVRKRRTIETVVVKNKADENDLGWSEEEWVESTDDHVVMKYSDSEKLLQAIGSISSLNNLVVDYYVHPISAKALSLALQGRSHMKSLTLRHTNIVGEANDFLTFQQRMLGHTTLSSIVLSSCTTDMNTVGPLVDAASSVPNLSELNVEEMDVPGESLCRLFRSSSLIKVKLRHVPASNRDMPKVAETLKSNPVIQDLQIQYSLEKVPAIAFFDMLEHNTSLQRVAIDVGCWDHYGTSIAKSLECNNRLKSLELNIFGEDSNVEANALAISTSLESNISLRRMSITFQNRLHHNETDHESNLGRIRKAFIDCLSRVIPKNFTLEEISIGFVHQKIEFDGKVKFFLKLNQAGRSRLMEAKSSRQDWIEMINRYRDDLDVLFYFLTMNPSVTNLPNAPVSVVIEEPPMKRQKLDEATRTMG